MNNSEFLHWFKDYINEIGRWKVVLSKESFDQYTLGCFINDNGEHIVYENDEHGHYIHLTTKDQNKAYTELKDLVLFEVKNNKGYI